MIRRAFGCKSSFGATFTAPAVVEFAFSSHPDQTSICRRHARVRWVLPPSSTALAALCEDRRAPFSSATVCSVG
eukprot:4116775-Pyramimonas_sp.AAC.1